MAKNSRDGNRERAARRRAALAERGIKQISLMAPEQAHPLLKQAADLMTRDDVPLEPRAALRQAGGANQPEPGELSFDLIAELDAAKAQIERQAEAQRIEIEAEKRQRQVLEVERDAARKAEAAEREKAHATAKEARAATRTAREAQEQAREALRRAEKAETAIRHAKALPGVRGRLVRWLVGDVLE